MILNPVLSFARKHDRENKDTTQDILLLLYLFERAGNNISGINTINAKVKLMKLVFLAEKKMVDLKYKGFNFFFNIYKRGPSSKELLQLIDDLMKQKLIDFDSINYTYSLTPIGRSVIKDFTTFSENNRSIFNVIDSILNEYGNLSSDEVVKKVYAMKIQPMYSNKVLNIGEAVKNSERNRLLMKINKEDTEKELEVSSDWVETINVLMNPTF